MDTVYLNGEFMAADQARVSVFDRGFLFADSVYEVIPFYQGQGFRLDEHLARLEYSLSALSISAVVEWQALLEQLVRLNGGGNLSVYLQVTRGAASHRTHVIDPNLTPTVFACCQPIKDIYIGGPDAVQAIRLAVTNDLRWQRCDIKATCLLPNILALQAARDQGATEAIMMRDNWLTEGASSNVFVVQDRTILTPALSEGILNGTTRKLVEELASDHAIPFREARISYAELLRADEVWISSSSRGVVPVSHVDGNRVADGHKGVMWREMFEYFTDYQRALMSGGKR